jgi:hypothetical protein
MLTLFTTAKSFLGPSRARQLNAIRSWKEIHPDVEIFLFGEGDGYQATADELGLIRIEEVLTSKSGCPRIDSMFALVDQKAHYPVRAYLNCDIIVAGGMLEAARQAPFPDFLMLAQRWNLDVCGELSFDSRWRESCLEALKRHGQLDDPSAIDMFLYRGNVWRQLPELIVGRGGYDNFLVYQCRRNKIPVVDATGSIKLIHQKHDYGHLAKGREEVFGGEEARANLRKAGPMSNLFTIVHADWLLAEGRLKPNRCRGDWRLWACANRSLYKTVDVKGCGWRATFWDLVYELYLRLQPDYARRAAALTKFPLWAFSRLLRWR